MRRYAGLALCAGVLGAGSAQAGDADYHEFLLNIPKAGKIVYTVSKDITKEADSQKETLSFAYVNESTFKQDGETYRFVPRFTKVKLNTVDGVAPPAGADTSPLTNAFTMMDGIGYVSDDSLLPSRVEDVSALKARLTAVMTASMSLAAGPGHEKEVAAAAEKAAAMNLEMLGENGIVLAYTQEQVLLSWPHNSRLILGKPIQTLLDSQYPLTGEPIKINMTMTLEALKPAEDLAVITWSSIPDAQSLTQAAKSGQAVLMARFGADAKDGGAIDLTKLVVKADSQCRYELSIRTGLIRHAECTSTKGFSGIGNAQMTTEHVVMSEALAPN